jgi:hypothetical protein
MQNLISKDESLNEYSTMSQIYILKNNNKHGPYSTEDVVDLIGKNKYQLNDLAWKKGLKEWAELGSEYFPELAIDRDDTTKTKIGEKDETHSNLTNALPDEILNTIDKSKQLKEKISNIAKEKAKAIEDRALSKIKGMHSGDFKEIKETGKKKLEDNAKRISSKLKPILNNQNLKPFFTKFIKVAKQLVSELKPVAKEVWTDVKSISYWRKFKDDIRNKEKPFWQRTWVWVMVLSLQFIFVPGCLLIFDSDQKTKEQQAQLSDSQDGKTFSDNFPFFGKWNLNSVRPVKLINNTYTAHPDRERYFFKEKNGEGSSQLQKRKKSLINKVFQMSFSPKGFYSGKMSGETPGLLFNPEFQDVLSTGYDGYDMSLWDFNNSKYGFIKKWNEKDRGNTDARTPEILVRSKNKILRISDSLGEYPYVGIAVYELDDGKSNYQDYAFQNEIDYRFFQFHNTKETHDLTKYDFLDLYSEKVIKSKFFKGLSDSIKHDDSEGILVPRSVIRSTRKNTRFKVIKTEEEANRIANNYRFQKFCIEFSKRLLFNPGQIEGNITPFGISTYNKQFSLSSFNEIKKIDISDYLLKEGTLVWRYNKAENQPISEYDSVLVGENDKGRFKITYEIHGAHMVNEVFQSLDNRKKFTSNFVIDSTLTLREWVNEWRNGSDKQKINSWIVQNLPDKTDLRESVLKERVAVRTHLMDCLSWIIGEWDRVSKIPAKNYLGNVEVFSKSNGENLGSYSIHELNLNILSKKISKNDLGRLHSLDAPPPLVTDVYLADKSRKKDYELAIEIDGGQRTGKELGFIKSTMSEWKPLSEIEEIRRFTKQSLSSEFYKKLGVGDAVIACPHPSKGGSVEPRYRNASLGNFKVSSVGIKSILEERTAIPLSQTSLSPKSIYKSEILTESVYKSCKVETGIRLYEDGSCFEVIKFGNDKPLSLPVIDVNMTLQDIEHIYSKTAIENLSRFYWAIGIREKSKYVEDNYVEPVNVNIDKDMKYRGVFPMLQTREYAHDTLENFRKYYDNSTLFYRTGYWWMARVKAAEKESDCKNPSRIGKNLVDVTSDNKNAFMYFNSRTSALRGKFLNCRID